MVDIIGLMLPGRDLAKPTFQASEWCHIHPGQGNQCWDRSWWSQYPLHVVPGALLYTMPDKQPYTWPNRKEVLFKYMWPFPWFHIQWVDLLLYFGALAQRVPYCEGTSKIASKHCRYRIQFRIAYLRSFAWLYDKLSRTALYNASHDHVLQDTYDIGCLQRCS